MSMFGRKPSARPPAQLGYTPPPAPVAVTPGMAKHILSMVVEYGGLVRQECMFEHLAGDERFGAHRENVRNARELQTTYYSQIERLLKGQP